MYQTPEQIIAMNKANLEAAMRFAGVAIEGAERMIDLQMKAAKSAFADSIQGAKALASVKDFQQLAALKDNLAQPSMEKATAYAKSVYDLTTETQAEIGKLVEAQVAEFNKEVVAGLDKMVKTAPAGSEVGVAAIKSAIAAVNSSYDNLTKVAKQFAQASQANLEAAATQATATVKKALEKSRLSTCKHAVKKAPGNGGFFIAEHDLSHHWVAAARRRPRKAQSADPRLQHRNRRRHLRGIAAHTEFDVTLGCHPRQAEHFQSRKRTHAFIHQVDQLAFAGFAHDDRRLGRALGNHMLVTVVEHPLQHRPRHFRKTRQEMVIAEN